MLYCISPKNKPQQGLAMHILHSLLKELKEEFTWSQKARELGVWFVYTLLAIILPYQESCKTDLDGTFPGYKA